MSIPHLVILAGPNGAGKSTAAPFLLKGALEVKEFVNADTIALGLSAFEPEKAAIQAGRVMLKRLDSLAEKKIDFAFETTLASRNHAVRVKKYSNGLGYHCHLFFLWLYSPELAVQRVAARVRMGGHNIPVEVIHRRYNAGLRNFFNLYRPLVTSWHFCDNSEMSAPKIIASGEGIIEKYINESKLWQSIKERYNG